MSKVVTDIAKETGIYDTVTRSPDARWAAPELGLTPGSMDQRSDVWSFGLVMMEVFTLKEPWDKNRANPQVDVMQGKLRPTRPISDWVTDEVWALMEECYREQAERPTMVEVERRIRLADQERKDNPPSLAPSRFDWGPR